MKFPKLISSLALAASIFSSYAQVSVWPLGHGPTNDYAYAVGSNNTGDLYFVKSQYDESLGFYIDKIMHTQLDRGGNWSEPSMLPAPINDNFNNSVVGLTPNADTLFLLGNYNAANPRLRPGLSYAVKNSNDEWFPHLNRPGSRSRLILKLTLPSFPMVILTKLRFFTKGLALRI